MNHRVQVCSPSVTTFGSDACKLRNVASFGFRRDVVRADDTIYSLLVFTLFRIEVFRFTSQDNSVVSKDFIHASYSPSPFSIS